MLELAMTISRSRQIPAIFFKESDDLPNFHAGIIRLFLLSCSDNMSCFGKRKEFNQDLWTQLSQRDFEQNNFLDAAIDGLDLAVFF